METPFAAGLKRHRQPSESDANSQIASSSRDSPAPRYEHVARDSEEVSDHVPYERRSTKRLRFEEAPEAPTPEAGADDSDIGFLKIHEVLCHSNHHNHQGHPRAALFFDQPRL